MVATRKTSQKISTISTKTLAQLIAHRKAYQIQIVPIQVTVLQQEKKHCCHHRTFKDNSMIFQKKKFIFLKIVLLLKG